MALIELFAWMTELSLFRLNQVPDKFYTHMLNLLGFEPFPATAARTDLTFWLVGRRRRAGRSCPAGTQVSDGRRGRRDHACSPRSSDLVDHPAAADRPSLVSPGPDAYVDVWDALRLANQAVICFPRTPTAPGDAFYLGFERLARRQRDPPRRSPPTSRASASSRPSPPLRWEVWQGAGWIPATVYRDTTGGLNRDGRSRCSSRPSTSR